MSWQGQVDGERIVTCVMAKAGGWGENSHLCHGRRLEDGERIVTCVMAEAGRWGENCHLCHGRGRRIGRE